MSLLMIIDDSEEEALQHHEIFQYECTACLGHWEEDNGDEWLRCANDIRDAWRHADCLEKVKMAFWCRLCKYITLSTCFTSAELLL